MSNLTPTDLYRAAALHALLQRGFSIETSVNLAQEAAKQMLLIEDNDDDEVC